MIPALTPPDEKVRLQVLREYDILDTPPELAFDEITNLLQEICGTPAAFVSLVDAKRHWFKSRAGLDCSETQLEDSFCTYTIAQPDVFVVPDATRDKRFLDNPVVAGEPNVVFYAGVPVRTSDGVAVGTLGVIDRVPRELTALQLRSLRVLGNQVAAQLELRKRRLEAAEQTRLQEQLRQSQKMEAIGQLASGVAHDFNNLLTVIQGNASLLLLDVQDAETKAYIQEVLQAAERAGSLTRQLVLFSRKQIMQPSIVDLNAVVANMTRMLQRILGEDIKLVAQCGPALPLVNADVGMMEQVLLNLAVNSRDAMPDGGQLVISTEAEVIGEKEAQQNPYAVSGPCVRLSVTDSGCGIPPEIVPHIFEPFFTTKEVGKGTGLGLATIYGIVRQHRGWLSVSSEPGSGATFHIYLPGMEGGSAEEIVDDQPEKLPGGNETILVVEDEEAVRLLSTHLLQLCGYTVLVASTGVAALEVWKQSKAKIDLLLTDMIMPDGMTGRQLAEQLQREKPELKVIYASGYGADVVGKGFTLVEGVNFLQKPYHARELAEAVRRRLDCQ